MSSQAPTPVVLPDGMLVCDRHHLEICTICCAEYSAIQESSFLQEVQEEIQEAIRETVEGEREEEVEKDEKGEKEEEEEDEEREKEVKEEEDDDDNVLQYYNIRQTSSSRDDESDGDALQYQPITDPKDKIVLLSGCYIFVPPPQDGVNTPDSIFHPSRGPIFTDTRLVRHSNPSQMLIFTHGACPRDGRPDAAAGCAFVFGPELPGPYPPSIVNFRLELRGPTDVQQPQTSNRAELRAVIAALQYHPWHEEGWRELIIATDSEYVTINATQRLAGWIRHGWRIRQGLEAPNRDLWEALISEVHILYQCGYRIHRIGFWLISREQNSVARRYAKLAAEIPADTERYTKIVA